MKNIKRNLKNNKENHKKKWLLRSFCSFIFILLLFFGFLNFFSICKIDFSGLVFNKKIEVSSYSFFAVSIFDSLNEKEAEECSKFVCDCGGAGNIFHDGEYYVLVSMYPSLIEAQEIRENLLAKGNDSKIVNILVEGVSKVYKGKNQKLLCEALEKTRKTFDFLYDLSKKIDSKEISIDSCCDQITNYLTQISILQSKIENLSKKEDKKYAKVICVEIEEVKNILYKLINFRLSIDNLTEAEKIKENDFLAFSHLLKNSYINVVFLNCELNEKINCL